ncbi:hypothetical protein GCM10027592_31040 [Spirosoma flavus]
MQTPLSLHNIRPIYSRFVLIALVLVVSLHSQVWAQLSYSSVPLTASSFNADVVANGSAANPPTASTTADIDNAGYFLFAQDYYTSSIQHTSGLPNNGLIPNAIAGYSSLTYQLASYNGNNSLRLAGTNNGTVTFVTPQAASEVYVLGASGSLASTVDMIVNYSDGTSTSFTGKVYKDWQASSASTDVFGATGRSNVATPLPSPYTANGSAPYLEQVKLTIPAEKLNNPIVSITFNKVSTQGFLNVMAVSVGVVPPTYTSVPLTATSFNSDVVANGSAANPPTASTTADIDNAGYYFISQDYYTASIQHTSGLPDNGLISNSIAGYSSLTYQLASYNGNNSLRLAGTNNGTVTFATPHIASEVFVLGTSGSLASTVDMVVNYSDGTSTTFPNQTYQDWLMSSSSTNVFGATSRGSVATPVSFPYTAAGSNPYLNQVRLTIPANKLSTPIVSITFNKVSTQGFLNIMAVSVNGTPICVASAPTLTASAQVSNQSISVTATGCAGTINWAPTGGTGQANGTIYTFSQPGSYSLSATCTQGSCTSPASNTVALQILPASFAITSVNMIQCQQVNTSRGQYLVRFNPLYSGANANPISFSVVNEMVTTLNSGPYTLTLFNDNPSITLVANQPGNGETRYSYNWLASCQTGTSPNQTPTTSGIPNQNLTQNQPYQLNLTTYFSDPDGQPLTFTAQGLPAGLSLTGSLISGTPSTTGVSAVSITALDPGGLSVSTNFQLSISAAPVTPPSGFAISGVSAVSCQLLIPNRYRVTFNPQYVGRDASQPFSFSVQNELTPTSQPGPYSLDLYTDNPTIRLVASQGASVSQYSYSWLSGCATPLRQGASEPGTGLQVRVLGNPVAGNTFDVEVQGAEAQPLMLRLVNMQGQLISTKNLEQATNQERIRLEVGSTHGLLLLQVNTPTQQRQLKVLKR